MSHVSIITALHNKGAYIGETIRSVLAQTFVDWELIVVENGSTDNGPEIVRQFLDARIRLAVSPKCGPGTARNFGIDHANGVWVLFLDADDLIEPEHLEILQQAANKNPEAGVVAGGWKEFLDDSPANLVMHRPATFGFSHDELLARAVALAPWILHAAMVKRSILMEHNRWPEQLDSYPDEDTAFWFPVILDAPVAWSDSIGALYRRFAANSRSDSGSCQTRVRGYLQIVEYNLAVSQKRGVDLSPKCYGHISMMFEMSYRKALVAKDKTAAEFALNNAKLWLNKCSGESLNIRLRQWLGIPTVNCLKQVFQRNKNANSPK
jgi:glycosyltransferase involved in cell wall biosynthesis